MISPAAPRPAAATPRSPAAPATLWQRRVHTLSPEEHSQAQPGWGLQYEQLSGGRFRGLVHHVQLPQARLVHEQCEVAVRQQGQFDANTYGFALALKPTAGAIFNGQRVQANDMMLGRNHALDLCLPAGYGLIAVVVEGELLVPLWHSMYGKPPSAWMESQLVVPTRPATVDALRRSHLQGLHDAAPCVARHLEALQSTQANLATAGPINGPPDHGPAPAEPPADDTAARQLRDAILIEWFEALPESIDASAVPTAVARKRLVDRACELLLSRPDEPLSMLEVCRRVGSSRRKLHYCFQDTLGTSPVKYLRAVRLNGARRELSQGGAKIQDVAARWGFWHLGQFSKDYKQQFDELPSQTCKRAAAPAA